MPKKQAEINWQEIIVCKRSLKDQSWQERTEQFIAESLAENDSKGIDWYPFCVFHVGSTR